MDKTFTIIFTEKKQSKYRLNLIDNNNITYELIENNAIVTPNKQQQRIILGYAIDALTHKRLPGVNVFIKRTTNGTFTDITRVKYRIMKLFLFFLLFAIITKRFLLEINLYLIFLCLQALKIWKNL